MSVSNVEILISIVQTLPFIFPYASILENKERRSKKWWLKDILQNYFYPLD